jgi:hypothetical protein
MDESQIESVREELRRKQTEIWEPYDGDPIPELFHFTSPDGFIGIIEKHQLWCTDVRHVNDPREGDHGLSVVQSIVTRKSVYRPFKEHVLDSPSLFGMKSDWTGYIFCFCSSELPHMWQDYAKRGTGCALVFNYDVLFTAAPGRYAFLRMLYNQEKQARQVEATLDHAINLERELAISGRKDRETYWRQVEFYLLTCAIRFKDPVWSEEHEVRLWVSERPDLRTFEAFGKPRVGMEFAPASLKRAVRGPAADEYLSAETIRRLLTENHFATVPVVEAAV